MRSGISYVNGTRKSNSTWATLIKQYDSGGGKVLNKRKY